MRYIPVYAVLLGGLLVSCSKEEKEPELTPLPIVRQFDTMTTSVRLSGLEDISGYRDFSVVVRSADELPDDPHFGTGDFVRADIDYSRYSLLVSYHLLLGDVSVESCRWGFNNWFDRYEFGITFAHVKDSEYDGDGEYEYMTYVRSAVLVNRLSEDARVTWWCSSTFL